MRRKAIILLLGLALLTTGGVITSPVGAQPCYGEPGCYDEPPPDPCYGEPECYDPPAIVDEPAFVWGGYSDGRLNPALDEYYSVWCVDNVIRVLRGVPVTALVRDIPLRDVIELREGVTYAYVDLTLVKSGDSITLSGNNGNLAPQSGSKTFSLTECVERNGGPPPAPTPEPQKTLPPPTPPEGSNLHPIEITFQCMVIYLSGMALPEICGSANFLPGAVGMLFAFMCGGVIWLPTGGLLGFWRWRRGRRARL